MLVRCLLILVGVVLPLVGWSQTVSSKLAAAYKTFAQDSQLRNGVASLYVINAKTGQVVFKENELIGLTPASTQKIITSVSAYELLGKNFRYQTQFGYLKNNNSVSILISPGGDPTLGSWRWPQTTSEAVILDLRRAVEKAGLNSINQIIVNNYGWAGEVIPDGWMWQDIGNYYGAGAGKFNWHENQYDVLLKSGKNIGDPVTIVKTVPALTEYKLESSLTAAATGSGDNAYIYFPLNNPAGVIRGTIPVNETEFKISGTLPNPAVQFSRDLSASLIKYGIKSSFEVRFSAEKEADSEKIHPLYTHYSPPLDSLIYWFNRKSINLYGEALIKTIAYEKNGDAGTQKGIAYIKAFWKQNGVPEPELNMVDGSGLSPLNRVTTHAQVSVLQYAQKQAWFSGFYQALPLYNGMKMKSGTIRGAKGFCGYHRSKDGQEYVFSFLVNNYNGAAPALVQKMYKVLDVLK